MLFQNFASAQTDSLNIVQSAADSIKDDDPSTVFIANISIYGNNKTKDFIIEREIPFKQGDNVLKKDLQKKLVIAKDQLINTSLFLDVSMFIAKQLRAVCFYYGVCKRTMVYFSAAIF